ncbi:hypothetical protein BDB00DRAFT_927433, partial [Zychaea mexicana]|uniref:uncharacterized protein n=1 Tax=Zychaea mexicana TaxID=64656 RepID=UPI0022FE5036
MLRLTGLQRIQILSIHCSNLNKLNGRFWDPDLTGVRHHNLSNLSLQFNNISDFSNFDPRPSLKAAPRLRSLSMNMDQLQTTDATRGICSFDCPRQPYTNY